jgi:CheY-like chemotaxis protein
MDIMMPEIDGIDTIREIRKLHVQGICRSSPHRQGDEGDREKCIEAGAWDYLSKPVETELMIGMLRAWLHR